MCLRRVLAGRAGARRLGAGAPLQRGLPSPAKPKPIEEARSSHRATEYRVVAGVRAASGKAFPGNGAGLD